nr:MAG: nonstructural protein [Microvirus sp.]
MTPFFMRSKGEALRSWQQVANDESTSMCKFPGDFSLFEIGEFDDENAEIKMHDSKMNLGTALEFKNKPTEQLPLLTAIEQGKGI